jgi:hypothetical protein
LGVRVSSRAAERIVAVKTRYLAPMSTKLLPVWSLLLLAGCAPSALAPLLVDGQELHASLATRKLNDVSRLHVPRAVIRDNPYLSTDVEFVDAIAHSASQGRLGGDGVRAALYALYLGESELGLYGLEGASIADTDRLEGALRRIWAHNERLGAKPASKARECGGDRKVRRESLVRGRNPASRGCSGARWGPARAEGARRRSVRRQAATLLP